MSPSETQISLPLLAKEPQKRISLPSYALHNFLSLNKNIHKTWSYLLKNVSQVPCKMKILKAKLSLLDSGRISSVLEEKKITGQWCKRFLERKILDALQDRCEMREKALELMKSVKMFALRNQRFVLII